ncbi:hypothetical protein AAIR98_001242 [Elusimicrobium simillimum]|uniref:hypothetical protein n=1 Tax=Elusimicrobium simillimum TaxID=3143438 RepID=UPI003C701818
MLYKKVIFCCALCALSLSARVTLYGGQNVELQSFFTKAVSFLPGEFEGAAHLERFALLSDIPAVLGPQNSSALALWSPSRKQILIMSSPLKSWLEQTSLNYSEEELPALFARCVAPVIIHEAEHALLWSKGREYGFTWPPTLYDEFLSSSWEAYFIVSKTAANPAYYAACGDYARLSAPALQSFKNKDFEAFKQYAYAPYLNYKGTGFLPPPFTADNIEQLLNPAADNLHFYGRIYAPAARTLSNKKLFKHGGNWLNLRRRELKKTTLFPFYKYYASILGQEESHIEVIIAGQEAIK